MPVATLSQLLGPAAESGTAVPAFNANCLEIIPALVEAAAREASPLILQISKRFLSFIPPSLIAALAFACAERTPYPVCLHLDHGAGAQQVLACLDAGFTSIMYDGSHLPLEENIRTTREVVALCNRQGVPVEGEVGKVLIFENGRSDYFDDLTKVKDAVRFVKETGVQALAVSVGNVHHMLRREARLDFQRIARLRQALPVPLVMHGSSGISDEDVRRAISVGISKVNVSTEFGAAFSGAVRDYAAAHPGETFPMELLQDGVDRVREMAAARIRAFRPDAANQ